jgi:hypothetical protein
MAETKSIQAGERTQIKAGDKVIHTDGFGTSAGVADSDEMSSRGEIKVSFTFGPRKGECRWMPLAEVRSVMCFEPIPAEYPKNFDNADEESDVAIFDPTRPRGTVRTLKLKRLAKNPRGNQSK